MKKRPGGLFSLILLVLIVLISARFIAGTLIDYAWWKELHQLDTWINLLLYGTVPILLAILIFFTAFWTAFHLGIRHTPNALLFGFLKRSFVIRVAAIVLALFSIGVANATVDSWTVVRFFGGLRQTPAPGEFIDPIFQKPLHFYLFDLPFFNLLLTVALVGAVLSLLIYWAAAHADRVSQLLQNRLPGGPPYELEHFQFRGLFDSTFIRATAVILLLGVALKIYFDRYALLLEDHGQYLVGVDWVADHFVIPLQWLLILAAIAAAA